MQSFPEITPVPRIQPNPTIPNDDGLLGLVSGEGSFRLRIIE